MHIVKTWIRWAKEYWKEKRCSSNTAVAQHCAFQHEVTLRRRRVPYLYKTIWCTEAGQSWILWGLWTYLSLLNTLCSSVWMSLSRPSTPLRGEELWEVQSSISNVFTSGMLCSYDAGCKWLSFSFAKKRPALLGQNMKEKKKNERRER